MTRTMTFSEFETLLDNFGSDIRLWPEEVQRSGRLLAETEEGRLLLAADSALDDMFVAARAIGPEAATDGNSDAFLDRLMDIPVYHHQVEVTKKSRGITFWLTDLFADSSDWLSPKAIASQAAGFVAVLGVGVVVGLTGAQADTEYGEIDISETWFVASSDYELDEQE